MGININIAGNLKRLRKERGITQDDLANFIGVSFQAVSKWECGDGYPDITILPVIANFFDVTLDELVGMNEMKNQTKLEEIKKQHCKLLVDGGTIKEIIECLRGGLKIFPNDYWLLSELAICLSTYDGSDTDEEKKKNNEESVKISERILEFCTDTEIRNRIQAQMCHSLYWMGEKEKAVELAKKLPKYYRASECTLPYVLDGKEKIKQYQNNIYEFTNELSNNILGLVWQAENDGYYTDEERLRISQKAIDIYKTVYDEGEFNFGHKYLSDFYMIRAKIYIKQGHKNEALKNLEEAVKHTIAYLNPSEEMHTSLLVNMLPKRITYIMGVNIARQIKNHIESELFESVREREEIKNILTELDKYAN